MNILYLHSHDTGRCIEPYGYPWPTPALSDLAAGGGLLRQAFAVASSCSAARASLQTSLYPHQNGMTGLAHRGWQLFDYDQHMVAVLRKAGYHSALIGEHHVAPDSRMIGYDEILLEGSSRSPQVAQAACHWLASAPVEPWLLSCGFWETHRTSFETIGSKANYTRPLPTLPDFAPLRDDAAHFGRAIGDFDEGVGKVLGALSDVGQTKNTLIVATTDHGPGFPGWKANVTDRGLGVFLIFSGPGVVAGMESDVLVSQLDVLPTICEAAGLEIPSWAEGHSLWPLLQNRPFTEVEQVYGQANFHAALEPQRTIRTSRHRLIRRFGPSSKPLANVDDGPSKDWALSHSPELFEQEPLQLYDLWNDPLEQNNLATDPRHGPLLQELDDRLLHWMSSSHDPLLLGEISVWPTSLASPLQATSALEPLEFAADSLKTIEKITFPPSPIDSAQEEK